MEKVIVCLSGGLDSVTLAHYVAKDLGKEIVGIFFDYGQSFRNKELESAIHCITQLNQGGYSAELKVIKLPLMTPNEDSYIAQRNTIFISYCAKYAEENDIKEIYVGLVDSSEFGVHYPDCDPNYIKAFNLLLYDYDIKVRSPFIHYDKHKVYNLAYKLGVDLYNIWSCNFPVTDGNGEMKRCMTCRNCVKANEYIYDDTKPHIPSKEFKITSKYLLALIPIFLLIYFYVGCVK